MIPTLTNEAQDFLSSDSYFDDFTTRLNAARKRAEMSRQKYAWLSQ